MTGDRPLTEAEKIRFAYHKNDQNFLEQVTLEGGETTLYEAALIEAKGALDAYGKMIIILGRDISNTETKIQDLKADVDKLRTELSEATEQ